MRLVCGRRNCMGTSQQDLCIGFAPQTVNTRLKMQNMRSKLCLSRNY